MQQLKQKKRMGVRNEHPEGSDKTLLFTHSCLKNKNAKTSWNKGLTAKSDPRVKRIADAKRADKNPNWKGGLREHVNGYMMTRTSDKKYRMQHVDVMEKHLGRKLKREEVIHHINGLKQDNRIENLQLFATQKEHMELHRDHQGKIRGVNHGNNQQNNN